MYTAYVVIFTLKHASVQATLYNMYLSEYTQVEIWFIRHVARIGAIKTIGLLRSIQVPHKLVHTFVRVKEVTMIPS